MKVASKAELLQEIAELRRVGAQMANVCFNLALRENIELDSKIVMARLRREWDAIPRRAQRPARKRKGAAANA